MIRHLDHYAPEPVIIEQAFGRFVHREFPVLVARVREMKNRDAGKIVGVVERGRR